MRVIILPVLTAHSTPLIVVLDLKPASTLGALDQPSRPGRDPVLATRAWPLGAGRFARRRLSGTKTAHARVHVVVARLGVAPRTVLAPFKIALGTGALDVAEPNRTPSPSGTTRHPTRLKPQRFADHLGGFVIEASVADGTPLAIILHVEAACLLRALAKAGPVRRGVLAEGEI